MPKEKLGLIVSIVCALLALLILQAGFIFLLMALLPSIVAWFADRLAGRPAFKTVFACNFAATMPSLLPLLAKGMSFQYLDPMPVMKSPQNWLIIYGGAAAGWCLVYLCRFIARLFLTVSYEYRRLTLERMQRKLLAEWGSQIEKGSSS